MLACVMLMADYEAFKSGCFLSISHRVALRYFIPILHLNKNNSQNHPYFHFGDACQSWLIESAKYQSDPAQKLPWSEGTDLPSDQGDSRQISLPTHHKIGQHVFVIPQNPQGIHPFPIPSHVQLQIPQVTHPPVQHLAVHIVDDDLVRSCL